MHLSFCSLRWHLTKKDGISQKRWHLTLAQVSPQIVMYLRMILLCSAVRDQIGLMSSFLVCCHRPCVFSPVALEGMVWCGLCPV